MNETGKASEGGAKGRDTTDEVRIPPGDLLYGAPSLGPGPFFGRKNGLEKTAWCNLSTHARKTP